MTLAEELVLFALDPVRGRPAKGIDRRRLRRGACAALLCELVKHRRLVAVGDGDHVAMLDTLPDVNPLLDDAGRRLARPPVPVAIEEAITRLSIGTRRLLTRLLRMMVARDILHDEREAFVLHRYPLRSQQALAQVRARIMSVYEKEAPEADAIALAAIADQAGVAAIRLSTEERFRMRRRLSAHGHADVALMLRIAHAV